MDRLQSMAAFAKVIETGSFAAAAVALDLSPQMVAKHVASLEGRLATRLLNRTTRRQSLTPIGSIFYERCKLVLADAIWADAAAEGARGVPSGRLRINAPISFGTHTLVPLVTRYLCDNPGVEIDLVLDDRLVDLIEEGYEVVFRIGPLSNTSLSAIELRPFRLAACASPAYLRKHGTPLHPDDLGLHECLSHAQPLRPSNYGWQFRDGLRIIKPELHGRLRCSTAGSVVAAALAGGGIAFVGEDVIHNEIAAGRLIRVLPGYEAPSRPIHLLFHPDRRQTLKLRSFIDAVVSDLGLVGTG
jgi:DNA-binding transcriptional LysR family regulator